MSGVFTISVDLEAAWGLCDHPLTESDKQDLELEREIVRRLLDLFGRYDIRASWAIVGHLLQRTDPYTGGSVAHPDIPRPVAHGESRDWFFQLPHNTNDADWYGFDLVEMVQLAHPLQEIGSHSFCHMPYDERLTKRAAVEGDLRKAKAIHEANGLPFQMFVFPGNVVGFRDLLAEGVEKVGSEPSSGVLCGWLPRCKDFCWCGDLVGCSLVSGLLMRCYDHWP